MTKRNNRNTKKFVAKGVSFPTQPVDLLSWAKAKADRQGRNFSGYIVELVLKDKQDEETNG